MAKENRNGTKLTIEDIERSIGELSEKIKRYEKNKKSVTSNLKHYFELEELIEKKREYDEYLADLIKEYRKDDILILQNEFEEIKRSLIMVVRKKYSSLTEEQILDKYKRQFDEMSEDIEQLKIGREEILQECEIVKNDTVARELGKAKQEKIEKEKELKHIKEVTEKFFGILSDPENDKVGYTRRFQYEVAR